MFTINIFLRFALIALSFGGSIALMFVKSSRWWEIALLLLVGIILLVGYILLGTVQSAGLLMQGGDMEGAEKRLGMTYFPQWLFQPNRAAFHLFKGTLASARENYELAEEEFTVAQKIGLPSDNEKAMVLMAFINLRARKNNWQAAENYYRQLKGLKITEPALKEQMKELDKAMSQRGQMTAASRAGFRGGYMPGGKRPRPKAR